jgi:threonine/homoserine/homoserine lactone efflux protein
MTRKLRDNFAVTEFFLPLTPGPAVLLVISQGMKFGFIAPPHPKKV